MNLAGANDKLVPYSCSKPFITWLKAVTAPGSSASDSSFRIEDRVYEGVGHWLSPDMAQRIDSFIVETLEQRQEKLLNAGGTNSRL